MTRGLWLIHVTSYHSNQVEVIRLVSPCSMGSQLQIYVYAGKHYLLHLGTRCGVHKLVNDELRGNQTFLFHHLVKLRPMNAFSVSTQD